MGAGGRLRPPEICLMFQYLTAISSRTLQCVLAGLRDPVILFADEAFFAGDRQHVAVLKRIVTEPTLTIEGKHQDAIEAPNFIHLIMASNENWGGPASLASRRRF